VPIICVFNGIVVHMFYRDIRRHWKPHIHADYGDDSAVFAIDSGEVLAGSLPRRQTRLVQAWIELRREELAADWILAVNGATLLPIDPLK